MLIRKKIIKKMFINAYVLKTILYIQALRKKKKSNGSKIFDVLGKLKPERKLKACLKHQTIIYLNSMMYVFVDWCQTPYAENKPFFF